MRVSIAIVRAMTIRHVLAAAALCVAAAAPVVATAQRPARPAAPPAARPRPDAGAPFAGRWTLDLAASENVERAIEETAARNNPLVAAVARTRLRATNVPAPTIDVTLDRDSITIARPATPVVRAPRDGAPFPWRRADGEPATVRVAVFGSTPPTVRERYETADGVRRNEWALLADGRTLWVDIDVTSPRLAAPLRYRLVYRRG